MGKILVVEDEELNLELMNDLLLMENHEVFNSDGTNLVEKVLEVKPDAILMDIRLTKFSGIDLIITLKNTLETQKIPIIAVTALTGRSDVVRIMQSGCNFYIEKPIAIDKFFLLISKLTAFKIV